MPRTIINAHEFSPKQQRAALDVLDTLDRVEERLIRHYGRKRGHDRKNYRGIVTVVAPVEELPGGGLFEEAPQFAVWARNISRSGLSFIHPGELKFRKLRIGLNSAQGEATWFTADVVRIQRVQDGFWEYGVAFTGRAQA